LRNISTSLSNCEVYSPVPITIIDDMVDPEHQPHQSLESYRLGIQSPSPQNSSCFTNSNAATAAAAGGSNMTKASSSAAAISNQGQEDSVLFQIEPCPPLRFNNGDPVFLKDVNGLFLKGRIVCGWYRLDQFLKEQNPDLPDHVAYLVRSELNNYVVVPVDDDAYICRDAFYD
jgi:hypothetical protein